jgi:ribosomal protein L32E
VCNVADLAKVDSKTQAAVIASAVSKKKRAEIQKAASEKKIQVLNYTE